MFYVPKFKKRHVPVKHTALPHLARPTLNELQRYQHEKTSLKCVRAQSPTGLALVPCTLNAVYKRRCWLPQTNKQKNSWWILKHHATWISTRNAILYKEPFFPWKTKEKRLALRARAAHYYFSPKSAGVEKQNWGLFFQIVRVPYAETFFSTFFVKMMRRTRT